MAALGGKYAFPDAGAPGGGRYSEGFREVVRRCLKVKVKERADIDEVRFQILLVSIFLPSLPSSCSD